MYEILEISLADTRRSYQFKSDDVFGADFHLKGFQHPWVCTARTWQAGEKILDVGAAYSQLPLHLQETHNCETWVVDDFGKDEADDFWTRRKSPEQHAWAYPGVKFVFERLGDPAKSSLPENYFDVVYSCSALEHVPAHLTPAVWKHMDRLLKPGGELLHAIDMQFPSNGGVKMLLKCGLFDAVGAVLPTGLIARHCFASPKTYTRMVFDALGIFARPDRRLGVLNMVLNPEILTENYLVGYKRIVCDNMKDYHFRRCGALLLRLRKV